MQNIITTAALLLFHGSAVSPLLPGYCSCHNSQVTCQNAALTSIPTDLDQDSLGLDLSFNNITAINNGVFDNLPQLRTISLSDNEVNTIDPEVFSHLQKLQRLDLRNNNITLVHHSLFQENPNLTLLDLSGNSIQSFQPDFHSDITLKFLNLSGNLLNSNALSSFLPISSLQTLDLSNNLIETISDEVFSDMVYLQHLDLRGNPIEYDCRLRNVWKLCNEGNIKCVTDDMQSWRMVDNLYCDPEVQLEIMALNDGFMELNTTIDDQEGSGSGMEPSEIDVTDGGNRTIEAEPEEEEEDWKMIAIIAGGVCGVVLVLIMAVIFIRRRIRMRENMSGNISRTNSIDYLNQEDQFNRSYKNSRNKVHNNHYDRVIPPEFNRNVLQFQVGDNVAADVVRVPSFKTRGVATPLNLPEEISPQDAGVVTQNRGVVTQPSKHSNSLTRSNVGSSYEESPTVRIGSLKKYVKPDEVIKINPNYRANNFPKVQNYRRS